MSMNGFSLLLAAVAEPATSAAAAIPWWREGWAVWPMSIATIVVPATIAWLLARTLRVSDMWGRIAVVLTSLAVAAVVIALGWPPRLGIDLKGGVILVYEVDTAKQAATARESAKDETRAADEAGLPAGRIDMDKLVAAVSRRVNPGGQKEVTVRQFGLDQIEVIVPAVDQAEIDLIKRVVSSAGVLEFRITANPDDPRHKQVIEAGTRATGSTVSEGGRPVGRWVELDTGKWGWPSSGGSSRGPRPTAARRRSSSSTAST